MRILDEQDIEDIIYGCTVLGTGGGGSLEGGLKLLKQDFAEGRTFRLIGLEEVPDDEYVAVPYMCGAISPSEDKEEEKYKSLPKIDMPEAMLAFKKMEEYFGREFFGVISTELGGENTADALHIAAQMDKAIVDGDPAGRSVPELQHSTFFINGIPITPMTVATSFGDTMVIDNVVDDFRAEALVRAIAVASKNEVGVVDHPLCGEVLKKNVIPGAITYALNVGKQLRFASEEGRDGAVAIVEYAAGRILFRGRVENHSWDTVDGFTVGQVNIDGIRDFVGRKYKIWFKNENIISYMDGRVDVTVPDLICTLDGSGMPVTNPNYKEGMEIVVFALPAPKEWTGKRGLEVFGPKSFGFDIPYRPLGEIEK